MKVATDREVAEDLRRPDVLAAITAAGSPVVGTTPRNEDESIQTRRLGMGGRPAARPRGGV